MEQETVHQLINRLKRQGDHIAINHVYLVIQGDYSSISVVGIFTEKETAERLANKLNNDNDEDGKNWNNCSVSKCKLNELKSEVEKGYSFFYLEMDKHGNIKDCRKENEYFYFQYDHSRISFINDIMDIRLYAKNRKHAIKIANERRRELILLNKWGAKDEDLAED